VPFAAAVAAFQQKFPSTLLRFDVESSAVVEPVLDGHCGVGVAGSWSLAPPQLTQERLLTVRVPTVVSPQHPLAKHRGPIPTAIAAKYVRLTHADPADISPTQRFAIGSGRVWRLSHLGAKLAFLRAGLGYGGLPLHMIESDLASGALVQIRLEDAPSEGHVIVMSAIYRTDNPPGPAGRWFIGHLKQQDAPRPKEKALLVPASIASPAKRQQRSAQRSLARKKKRSH
jgi:DNA-binding transcriptional LysR family regulator